MHSSTPPRLSEGSNTVFLLPRWESPTTGPTAPGMALALVYNHHVQRHTKVCLGNAPTSPHEESNPGPTAYKAAVLPLNYRGVILTYR